MMNPPPLTVANVAEFATLLGGTFAAARLLEVKPSNVSNWKRKGQFPEHMHRRVKTLAARHSIDVPDALFGRPFAESAREPEPAL